LLSAFEDHLANKKGAGAALSSLVCPMPV